MLLLLSLIEFALKISVSIPAWSSSERIQRASVEGVTGLWGLMNEINNLLDWSFIIFLNSAVIEMYCWKQATGHNLLSSGKQV
jgi:hypothetical protein